MKEITRTTIEPGRVVYRLEESSIVSIHSGELEENRKSLIRAVVATIFSSSVMVNLSKHTHANVGAEDIRIGFSEILDIFTAIAEPILWFYALTACVLMATKNKEAGWQRLKQVAYAYAAIALLPTFFALLRWMSDMIQNSISF